MRVPTGAIDQTFNLIHKLCGIVLMVLAIAFVSVAGCKILRTGGAVDVFVATELHADETAGSTQRAASAAVITIRKLGDTADAASVTIRQANTTIAKMGNAIDATQANLTATTGAVNATLGQVQSTLTQVRTDAETANTAIAGVRPVLDHLDAAITDPAIHETVAHVNGIAAHVEGISSHVEGMAADSEIALHKAYHPSKWAVVRGLTVKGFFVWLSHF